MLYLCYSSYDHSGGSRGGEPARGGRWDALEEDRDQGTGRWGGGAAGGGRHIGRNSYDDSRGKNDRWSRGKDDDVDWSKALPRNERLEL